jgi:hypothetical protein
VAFLKRTRKNEYLRGGKFVAGEAGSADEAVAELGTPRRFTSSCSRWHIPGLHECSLHIIIAKGQNLSHSLSPTHNQ